MTRVILGENELFTQSHASTTATLPPPSPDETTRMFPEVIPDGEDNILVIDGDSGEEGQEGEISPRRSSRETKPFLHFNIKSTKCKSYY